MAHLKQQFGRVCVTQLQVTELSGHNADNVSSRELESLLLVVTRTLEERPARGLLAWLEGEQPHGLGGSGSRGFHAEPELERPNTVGKVATVVGLRETVNRAAKCSDGAVKLQ